MTNNYQVELTDNAKRQLLLMKALDETIKGKDLRITIDGKGCDGFLYGIGFDECRTDDTVIDLTGAIKLIMDPFCSEYLNHLTIDYHTDFEKDEEGLIVINHRQEDVSGKFWKN